MWLSLLHPAACITPESVLRRPVLSSDERALRFAHTMLQEEDTESEALLQLWEQSSHPVLKKFYEGLSPSVRGIAWQVASRSIELCNDNTGIYEYLQEPKSEHFQNIVMDSERTLPQIPNFTEQHKDKLNRILNAYSNKDKEMGYSQGMNYFVAVIVQTEIPEENAFWLLMRIMKGFSLERIFPNSFSVISDCFTKFEKLLQIYCPAVYHHVTESLEVLTVFYLQQWFQTVFSYNQRMDLSLRVFDLMMIRKIEALFCVSIAIMVLSEEKLLSMNQSNALSYLRALDEDDVPTNDIIELASGYPDMLLQLRNLEATHVSPQDFCNIM